eukprot:g4334.t1
MKTLDTIALWLLSVALWVLPGVRAKDMFRPPVLPEISAEHCPASCGGLFRRLRCDDDNDCEHGKQQNVDVQERGEPKSGTGFMYEWATGALGHACAYLAQTYGEGTCWVEWEFSNRTMIFDPSLAADDDTARCPCHDVQRVKITILNVDKHALPVTPDCEYSRRRGMALKDDIVCAPAMGEALPTNRPELWACVKDSNCRIVDDHLQLAVFRDPRPLAAVAHRHRIVSGTKSHRRGLGELSSMRCTKAAQAKQGDKVGEGAVLDGPSGAMQQPPLPFSVESFGMLRCAGDGRCHEATLVDTDLILYYARGEGDGVAAALPSLARTGGKCFATTRLILANLSDEENVYPKGASVQFYKLFLDPNVRRHVTEYDALAIIEWDVLVAHNTSFERLYGTSFGGVEPFWVKGSTLEGVNFHETVVLPDHRHVLGHINGNAIYNNTDPAFVDFVNFTFTRWEYTHSYDVALWATIADFPYSWPLWQRYSRKFVAIDLIANVGFLDVNGHAVQKAVGRDTLFIHGSLTGGGGSMFKAGGTVSATSPAFLLGESSRSAEMCKPSCGAPATFATSSVCDGSCFADREGGARFGGHLCGAGNITLFGEHCRTCYTDLDEARAAETLLAEHERMELGRTVRSQSDNVKKHQGRRAMRALREERYVGMGRGKGQRGGEEDGVMDGGGGGGTGEELGEEVKRGIGEAARGVEWTHEHDAGDVGTTGGDMMTVRRHHVVMCDTLMPPTPASGCSLKCQKKDDTVCDRSCGTGRFGDYNCNWRGYGAQCRFCFNDRDRAILANDVAKRRGGSVIMCHTLEPPVEHESLPIAAGDDHSVVGGGVGKGHRGASDADQEKTSKEREELTVSLTDDDTPVDPADEPFVEGIKRGQICAFMTGFSFFIMETKVAVESVLHFMPGMRVAIATQAEEVSVFERTMGNLPGVRISEATSSITLAPLLADRYCGEGTELILYMNPGELLSRPFTSKDTHSTAGDLLVVYAEVDRIGEANLTRVMATMLVLGFSTPSFSFGTDIMLPVYSNQQLRDVLLSTTEEAGLEGRTSTDRDLLAVHTLGKFADVFVPEVLAALTYARNPPGVWFINPQQWVTHHMFEPASIWDIPLVKPRFGCAFDMSMAVKGYDMAAALEAQLSHFMSGSSCELGFMDVDHKYLRPKANIEFGFPTTREMPTITEARLRVSVVFYAGRTVRATLLDASISSVVARFPEAAEVVVVFTEAPAARDSMMNVLKSHEREAPFPVEIVEYDAPFHLPRGGWPGWSGLGVDDIASGEFVMQLEVGDILVEDVTYDNVFHFRKPVIPFLRLSLDGGDTMRSPELKPISYEDRYIACGIEAVIEMDAVRDFALLRGLAYPRAAYSEMRMFASEVHNVDIDDLVEQAHESCKGITMADGSLVGPRVGRGIFEASLLGSFLWKFVHDMVHWRALDPLDIQPDEWLSDIGKYNLWCSMGHIRVPDDESGEQDLAKALTKINTRAACNSFVYDSH